MKVRYIFQNTNLYAQKYKIISNSSSEGSIAFSSCGNTLKRLVTVYEKVMDIFETELTEAGQAIYYKRYAVAVPNCFISYAWGRLKHENFVRKKLTKHLKLLLNKVNVVLDEVNNTTDNIGRFANLVATKDRVILIATKATLEKYNRGIITERIFTDIGLSETEARALFNDFVHLDIIKNERFNWDLDFEQKIERAVAKIFDYTEIPDSVKKQKENVSNKLLNLYKEQKKEDLPTLQKEINTINDARLNKATKKGTILLVLLEAVPDETIPIPLRGLPVLFFNQGKFTKTDLSFLYLDQIKLEDQWQMLMRKKYIDSDKNEARPTRVFTDKLKDKRAELVDEIGLLLVEFLETVHERYYTWNFLKLAGNLNIPDFGEEKINEIIECLQNVIFYRNRISKIFNCEII